MAITISPAMPAQQAADDVDQALDARRPARPTAAPPPRCRRRPGSAGRTPCGCRTPGRRATTTSIMIQTWNGTPSTRPRPMNWNSGVLKTCRSPLVEHLGDAAAGDEQDQRRDDRLDAKAGDQPAVEQAEACRRPARAARRPSATPTSRLRHRERACRGRSSAPARRRSPSASRPTGRCRRWR